MPQERQIKKLKSEQTTPSVQPTQVPHKISTEVHVENNKQVVPSSTDQTIKRHSMSTLSLNLNFELFDQTIQTNKQNTTTDQTEHSNSNEHNRTTTKQQQQFPILHL